MADERAFDFINLLPEATLLVASTGQVLAANRAACVFLNRPLDRILGHGLCEIAATPAEAVGSFLRSCSRTRERVINSLAIETSGAVMRYRAEGFLFRPKTEQAPAEILIRLLPRETTTGKFLLLNERIDQLSREIAARRRAEEQVRDERELLEVTLRSIGDAVIVSDTEGRVTFQNSVSEQLTGWTSEEARGEPLEHVFRIVNEQTGATVENPVTKVLREGEIVGLANHTVLIAKDRSQRPIDDSGAPIRDHRGNLRGVVLVYRDVSERKRIEEEREGLLQSERAARTEAERASRMKDEFLATLSHELRTPLNAILGYATLLQMGSCSDEDVREAIDTIARNARLQAQLIEDLLDMNRIISGKVRLDVQLVDLQVVIDSALETMRPSAEVKELRVRRIIDPRAGLVRGDPNRLQQVVWNLLSNAVKFTAKGGRIDVSVERTDSKVEIIVADSGQGIAAEFLPHVFDRFRQADSSLTRQHGGLGLGLSIVKQLVELHGGTVRAKSPGLAQGATFIVSLPLAVLQGDAQDEVLESPSPRFQPAENINNMPDLAGVRILVVDDEADTCRLVGRVLEECRGEVDCATSAAHGLQLLASRKFDVLISDIGMPEEDGYQFISKVRRLGEARGGNIPAVALTAFARSEDRRRAAMAGFQTHLAKPVEALELIAVVANLAGRIA